MKCIVNDMWPVLREIVSFVVGPINGALKSNHAEEQARTGLDGLHSLRSESDLGDWLERVIGLIRCWWQSVLRYSICTSAGKTKTHCGFQDLVRSRLPCQDKLVRAPILHECVVFLRLDDGVYSNIVNWRCGSKCIALIIWSEVGFGLCWCRIHTDPSPPAGCQKQMPRRWHEWSGVSVPSSREAPNVATHSLLLLSKVVLIQSYRVGSESVLRQDGVCWAVYLQAAELVRKISREGYWRSSSL